MARINWKDRIVERPRTFNTQNNPDGSITLIPAPGEIIQEGTPVNAENLNRLGEEYDEFVSEVLGKLEDAKFTLITSIEITQNTQQVEISIPDENKEFIIIGKNIKAGSNTFAAMLNGIKGEYSHTGWISDSDSYSNRYISITDSYGYGGNAPDNIFRLYFSPTRSLKTTIVTCESAWQENRYNSSYRVRQSQVVVDSEQKLTKIVFYVSDNRGTIDGVIYGGTFELWGVKNAHS